jgi:hypothetical protein
MGEGSEDPFQGTYSHMTFLGKQPCFLTILDVYMLLRPISQEKRASHKVTLMASFENNGQFSNHE